MIWLIPFRQCNVVNNSTLKLFQIRRCHVAKPRKVNAPNAFVPSYVQSSWYEWWNSNNFFDQPSTSNVLQPSFFFCLPPPNITGNLHIGHALTVTIEDTIARWRKMSGMRVIWVPGFDHAGIATQLVVERRLFNLKQKRRVDMTREEFIDECLLYKSEKVDEITRQLQNLGASVDWNRSYYTMDENFSEAVFHAFATLFDQDLITRSSRLVNWSPYLKSTLSDIEIDTLKVDAPKDIRIPGRKNTVSVGYLYFVKYEIVDQPPGTYVVVATTRPETIPADVAVAVHPEDSRYSALIGRCVRNPLQPEQMLPIIADNAVLKDLGTGALKVTPGHDWTDYDIGIRHSLPLNVNIFDESGMVNEKCSVEDLRRLERFDAREKTVHILNSRNLLVEKRTHPTTLRVCGRSGDLVEPMPKEQWFLNCKNMVENVVRALDDKRIKFTPEYHERQLRFWLSDARDWCISRQLSWGHRIPVYKIHFNETEETQFVVGRSEKDALSQCASKFSSLTVKSVSCDPDVLDTWFSSSLVPLVISGWPKNLNFLNNYPLNLMETGSDILSFWVSRMAMMCLHFSGEVPFKEVLLHGIVRDAQGRKMSKSLGNVIDPMDVISGKSVEDLFKRVDSSDFSEEEKALAKDGMKLNFPKGIAECGVDALRFSLLTADIKDVTISIRMSEIEAVRHFCNKIYQAFRYMLPVCAKFRCNPMTTQDFVPATFTYVDMWLLSRLSSLLKRIETSFDTYDFQIATKEIVEFWWHDFCDVYLEWTKKSVWENDELNLKQISLVFTTVGDVFLRLLAPIMPFLAEELYSMLPWAEATVSIHQQSFPFPSRSNFSNENLEREMEIVQTIMKVVRSLKIEIGLLPKNSVQGIISSTTEKLQAVATFSDLIKRLTLFEFTTKPSEKMDVEQFQQMNYVHGPANGVDVFLEVKDSDRVRLLQRVESEIKKIQVKIVAAQEKIKILKQRAERKNVPFVYEPKTSIADFESEVERLKSLKRRMNG